MSPSVGRLGLFQGGNDLRDFASTLEQAVLRYLMSAAQIYFQPWQLSIRKQATFKIRISRQIFRAMHNRLRGTLFNRRSTMPASSELFERSSSRWEKIQIEKD